MARISWLGMQMMHVANALRASCAAVALGFAPIAAAQSSPSAISAEALRAGASDAAVTAFYESASWQAMWSSQTRAQLERALENSVRHAIDADIFAPQLQGRSLAERELAYTRTALAYADALAHGLVNPTEIRDTYTLNRHTVDVAAGLRGALREQRVDAWLASLAPQDQEYRLMSDAYVRARQAIGEAGREPISSGSLIREGSTDPRVPAVARRLENAGYLDSAETPRESYDAELASAVERFQEEHGLSVDGVVGPNTLGALNRGPFERARTLAVNLERRRWLTRTPPPNRVDVNIAASHLDYFRDGSLVWQTRVITGEPDWTTPQLQETFSQLVVNPPWTVPHSIAQQEIRPRGEDYLRRNDMFINSDGFVVQRPGPNAALGLVKFDMQNRWAIYLHDTPAKNLFNRAGRHFSHGCVRVEDAVEFARRLAREDGIEERFNTALDSGETQVVELNTPVHVRLIYQTAFASDGEVRIHPDAYGWDDDVASALGLGPSERPRTRENVIASLGP